MPASEREASRDPELRHQHSWSDSGRSSVPMWDSSDPDRAPPPLPLNPGSQSPTKANVSSGIAAAAKQIVGKARENVPISSYTSNRETPSTSPDRSLVKGAQHKRLQSLQTNSVKDLRSYLDNRSPERSPERPLSGSGFTSLSRQGSRENLSSPLDRSNTPTPSRDPLKDTPTLRPSARSPTRPLLGRENTPPSATMLALQTMQVPDSILNDISNSPGTPTPSRPSTTYDFSSQLLNLTSIANNLQKEMAQLSRRSKDNATDLISLKEATGKRDEDIRKSLRELTNGISLGQGLLGPAPLPGTMSRSASSFGTYMDSKTFSTPPPASSLPRAASASGFFEDKVGSPSPYSIEGAASVAMLEKIVREMVTKEGQERLQSSLSELLEKSSKGNIQTAKKVEELSDFIKEKSQSHALVPFARDSSPPKLDLNFDSPGSRTREAGGKEARMIGVDDEIMKMLQRIKDSIAHAGGTTSEAKGLIRDLRGEVLGMGRELGQKLDTVAQAQLNSTLDQSIEDGQGKLDAEQVHSIVEDSMMELKEHLAVTLKQRTEQQDDTFKQLATRTAPDSDEMFAVVKHALAEHGGGIATRDFAAENGGIDRETVLEAVKEGLKDFEPNIEIEQIGLERDEVLEVLKEGFEGYQNSRSHSAVASIDRGEIYEAMHEALKDFHPGLLHEQIEQMKDDMLGHVRQALLEYMPESSGPGSTDETTRSAIVEAVKEAVAHHGARELEISRDDLFDAVKASLDGSSVPFGGLGEQVLQQLHELFDGMRSEFREYTAANGRDTEQVLDAVKDGLESLRAAIESYVDRAQDVTGKDEIIDTVKTGLEQLQGDVQAYSSQGTTSHARANDDMLEYIRLEFENLHRAVDSRGGERDFGDRGTHDESSSHTAGLLYALKESVEELKSRRGAERGVDEEESKEEMLEAMKEEFEQLKNVVLNANAHDRNELIETIQDSMGALHAKVNGSQLEGISTGATEEIISELHAEFNQLKVTLHSIIGDADREAIIAGVRQSIDDLRVQLSGDQSDASAEALGAIKEELERFRRSMSNAGSLSRGLDDDGKTIRSSLDEIKDSVVGAAGPGMNNELLEALRGEFENLRSSIANGSVVGSQTEEVLDEVRVGLDDLRNHVDKKLDNPDQATKHHGDFLDAINDGLETLRTDIVKTLDKPLDMTVNYEILDTLKEGLLALRADIDRLKGGDGASIMPKGGEIVLADENAIGEARDINAEPTAATASSASAAPRTDLTRIEVLLSQLQIKVEAMEATVHDMPGMQAHAGARNPATKDDIEALEHIVKKVQDGVDSIGSGGAARSSTDAATKEDTDAIETLLRNTKGQLEDMAFPDPSNVVTKDQFDALEAVVRVTNEGIDGLADKLENSTAAKADVAVVEVLAQDLKSAIDDLKVASKDDKPDLMTKADLDVLGVMVTEIKSTVNEMTLPDPDELPSKADIEQLHGLISDFRDSHDKMRDGYDKDIAITAKAFDDRRQEFEDTAEQISSVKKSIADFKNDMLTRMGEGDYSLDDLHTLLKTLEEKTEPMTGGVKDLQEKVTVEFDRANASLDLMKLDQQQFIETSTEKQIEQKDALVQEIGEKLETYFDGLMSKYDDAQTAAEQKAKAMEDKAAQQDELLDSMKAMAEELRLSIDTLGSTLTSFPDTIDKLTAESKIMFNRVDDTYNKLDETQEGLKYEHSVTRDEVAKVLASIGGLQSDLSEHNPRFLVALKEVQALMGQHYEHSQQASNAAAEHAQAVKDLQDQIRGIGAQNEELKTDVSALPRLMPASALDTASTPEKYDDRGVHEKLDKLMGHAEEASGASIQLERLDQIHEKVMATATEVSAFVAMQAKQITQDHESKEKEAEELAMLLERRQVQKDEIEADITVLNDEKDSLQSAVENLKAEKEALSTQKSRLAAEISSLETAMRIRREELHEMDGKAEAIERRMLEGVMNQSRMLLLAKSAKPAPKKKQQGRDLRVPSNSSAASAQTVTSSVPALKANHALALKSRPTIQRNGAPATSADRRIMSLNQINHNIPTGGSAFSPAPSLASGAPMSLKRSHSVKTQIARKPSWAAKRHLSIAEHDKENEDLEDVSEDELQRSGTLTVDHRDEDHQSRADSHRKVSNVSSSRSVLTHTDAGDSFADIISPSIEDDSRASYGMSNLSSGTGSYLTGSEIDRHSSLGSSAGGILGAASVIDEDPNEEFHETNGSVADEEEDAVAGAQQEELMQIELAPPPLKLDMQRWAPPSDSGVGTDLPTAGVMSVAGDSDYFKSL